MDEPEADAPLPHLEPRRRPISAAVGCALVAFVAGLPFLYVVSFFIFMAAIPLLHPHTFYDIEPFYAPLIWLCLQGETVQRWFLGA